MSLDLVAFVRSRLDEDEAVARAATAGPWSRMGQRVLDPAPPSDRLGIGMAVGHAAATADYNETAVHIVRWGPTRALAEIEAKRQLIKSGDTLFCTCDFADSPPMDPDTNWTVQIPHHYDCTAYRIAQVLATAYRDHPDYREEWLPFEWET